MNSFEKEISILIEGQIKTVKFKVVKPGEIIDKSDLVEA